MSSNKITTTEPPIKSLEIKTKEEEKKLFKDDVLDKFNFWIYVAFVLLGLILIISFILLIYSIFSSSSSSSPSLPIKPPEPPIIIPKVNINPNPIQIPPPPPPPPQPILKKVEEPKPSFFSSLFGNTSKPPSNSNSTPISTPTPIPISNSTPSSNSTSTSNSTYNSLPKLNTSSNNNSSSIFSRFTNLFSPRTNIPKPTDTTKITGGKYIKRYKNYRYNNK